MNRDEFFEYVEEMKKLYRGPSYEEWVENKDNDFETNKFTYESLVKLALLLDQGLTEKGLGSTHLNIFNLVNSASLRIRRLENDLETAKDKEY